MIISNLVNSSRVEVLHPLFKKLFDFVRSYDFSCAPLGRIDIDGDNKCDVNCDTNGDGKCDVNCSSVTEEGDNKVDIDVENDKILYVSYLQGIDAPFVTPDWSGSQLFSVNNTSDYTLAFNIKFKNVYNDFNPTSEFVYSLSQNGTILVNETPAPTEDGYLIQNVVIPPHTTYEYRLTYHFVETGQIQDNQQGKRFTADLEVEAAS